MAQKTVFVCDCCGRQVEEIYQCYKELRTWAGYKQFPRMWDLCPSCLQDLEDCLKNKADEIKNDSDLGLI